jgi:hypothetical protein
MFLAMSAVCAGSQLIAIHPPIGRRAAPSGFMLRPCHIVHMEACRNIGLLPSFVRTAGVDV